METYLKVYSARNPPPYFWFAATALQFFERYESKTGRIRGQSIAIRCVTERLDGHGSLNGSLWPSTPLQAEFGEPMSALNTARSTAFIRLRQEGRTDEVARRLVEAIELGLFAEGQQLPSESELALQLGVATVTLREALVVLRERGLIETRRGRNGGSFVCAPVELPEALLLQRLKEISGPDLRDLCDEQMAISGTAARLAAQRSSPEQLARIAHHIEALGQSTTRLARHRADARFHIEVAAAAQSLRLTHAEMRLQSEVGELLWLEAIGGNDVTLVEQEHRAILQALVNNDSVLAGALAQAHVMSGIKRLIGLRLELLAASEEAE